VLRLAELAGQALGAIAGATADCEPSASNHRRVAWRKLCDADGCGIPRVYADRLTWVNATCSMGATQASSQCSRELHSYVPAQ